MESSRRTTSWNAARQRGCSSASCPLSSMRFPPVFICILLAAWSQKASRGCLALAFGDQFTDLRYEFMRNVHDRFGGFNAGLVLRQGIFFSLPVVIGEHTPYFLFVPIWRKLVVAHCCFFLLRLRKAASG